MDGAMATELFKKGLPFDLPAEAWNLTRPDDVRAVHEAYLAAGATCILANTFQANPVALAKHGLEDELEEILRAGVRIAREARGPERYVLATIGPLGAPYDSTALERIISSLEGVDGILLETFSDVDALWLAKYAVLPRLGEKKLPILVSISYLKNGSGVIGSLAGQSADALARSDGAVWPERTRPQLRQKHGTRGRNVGHSGLSQCHGIAVVRSTERWYARANSRRACLPASASRFRGLGFRCGAIRNSAGRRLLRNDTRNDCRHAPDSGSLVWGGGSLVEIRKPEPKI